MVEGCCQPRFSQQLPPSLPSKATAADSLSTRSPAVPPPQAALPPTPSSQRSPTPQPPSWRRPCSPPAWCSSQASAPAVRRLALRVRGWVGGRWQAPAHGSVAQAGASCSGCYWTLSSSPGRAAAIHPPTHPADVRRLLAWQPPTLRPRLPSQDLKSGSASLTRATQLQLCIPHPQLTRPPVAGDGAPLANAAANAKLPATASPLPRLQPMPFPPLLLPCARWRPQPARLRPRSSISMPLLPGAFLGSRVVMLRCSPQPGPQPPGSVGFVQLALVEDVPGVLHQPGPPGRLRALLSQYAVTVRGNFLLQSDNFHLHHVGWVSASTCKLCPHLQVGY